MGNKFRARGVLKTDFIRRLWPSCFEVTARLAFTGSDGTENNYPLILDKATAQTYNGYAVDVEGYIQPLPCRSYTGQEVNAISVTSIVPISSRPVSGNTRDKVVAHDDTLFWIALIAIAYLIATHIYIPYKTTPLTSIPGVYCENGTPKMRTYGMGISKLALNIDAAAHCMEYKSSRCQIICVNGTPSCQCEATISDILLSREYEWLVNK
ncbi:MAG: hypothetical protein GXN93_01815 [Candidatus Diapherotrites archaeon]|nr:hypothetical protein [Candidatus Diapherotrites archaeon]